MGRDSGRKLDDEAPGEDRVEFVSAPLAGIRLDRFLVRWLGLSRIQARRLLESEQVSIGGRIQRLGDKGSPLKQGTRVEVACFRSPQDWRVIAQPEFAIAERSAYSPDAPILGILAEGAGWIAVDKCARAPVHPLGALETGTVLNVVAALRPAIHGVGEGGLRSGVVHRLDVETSGVLLLAYEEGVWLRLRSGFRDHRIRKIYHAIVHGRLEAELDLEVGLEVARHRPARVRVVSAAEAAQRAGVRVATQHVRPLEFLHGATLVEVRPRTGFLHQIRATLAALGHPLLGDKVYAESVPNQAVLTRHMLHAAQLHFEEIEVESPWPEDFRERVDTLRN